MDVQLAGTALVKAWAGPQNGPDTHALGDPLIVTERYSSPMGDNLQDRQPTVVIETRSIEPAQPDQVRSRRLGSDALVERGPDIEAALQQMTSILRAAAEAQVPQLTGSIELEAKFGLTLGLEQGILFSKVDAGASFEVTVKIQLAAAP
ncbi:hypothetical protein ASF96_10270 [Microbacterium sp. Leaf179]|nr:hypothetical protein ASF96_10270 [Microbacterium sp. Leaf179]